MSEPDHIDIKGPLDDILSAYQNHPRINEIKRRYLVNDDEQFEFHAVTQVDIFKILSSLNSRKACGYDGPPKHLPTLGAPILSFTLLPILNNAIEQNVFPTYLTYAEVTILFKKEDKMNKEKYRPISVLVCQSKVFEGIMVDQLIQFMNGKLSDLLSAYRNDYSTQHVYLINRMQRVKLDDVRNSWKSIVHGVPQLVLIFLTYK